MWADGCIFAVGDCHYGAVVSQSRRPSASTSQTEFAPGTSDEILEGFAIPPVPKTAFAAICWARAACRNIGLGAKGYPTEEVTWPSEAGIIAVGLGPKDGVVAWKVKWILDSGEIVMTGEAAAEMKRRLVFSGDRESLATPSSWLSTFQEGLPPGRLLSERGRSALGLSDRAW